MKILIAPDSFKDCMAALEVANFLARGILKVDAEAEIRKLPMADGGEGTVESLIDATGGRIIKVQVHDPLLREVPSFYGISGDGSTAVIEMAAASGLELLKQSERNPWLTSTRGTGELIVHALDQGCSKILLGIGGSATNDCGMGMARALGVAFLDDEGKAVPQGGGALGEVRQISMEDLDPRIANTEIEVACDVTNPLSGPKGASFVYGPQKGADREMVEKLDYNLQHMARLIREQLEKEIDTIPGAGAAGGLGAGLMAFLDARLVKGFDMVAEAVSLEGAIQWADLVITGEGKMDRQTLYGKTPMGVAKMAQKYGKAVIGVAGTLEEDAVELYGEGFDVIMPIQEKPTDLASALENAPLLLEHAGERIARMLKIQL
ncbi:MAG: glycerate kinase [Bacteroides sp.]|nr:glycerate kinase [Bacteroides sp.]